MDIKAIQRHIEYLNSLYVDPDFDPSFQRRPPFVAGARKEWIVRLEGIWVRKRFFFDCACALRSAVPSTPTGGRVASLYSQVSFFRESEVVRSWNAEDERIGLRNNSIR